LSREQACHKTMKLGGAKKLCTGCSAIALSSCRVCCES
jgi:hypothetical protein